MKLIFSLSWPYIQQFKWRVLLLVTLSASAGLLSIVAPYISGSFVDFLISPNANVVDLLAYCLAFLSVSLVGLAMNYVSSMSNVKVSTSMAYKLNRDTIAHIHSLSYSMLRKNNPASMTQRVNNDSNQIISFSLNILCNSVVNTLTFIAPFVLLLSINVWAGVLIAAFGIIYVVAYINMRKKLYETGYASKEAQAIFFGHLNDQILFFKFIKDNGLFSLVLKKLDLAFSDLFSKVLKFQRVNYVFNSLDGLIVVLSQITLFMLGGVLVIAKTITVGEFTILNSYAAIILTSIRFFFGLGRDTQNTLVSRNRIAYLLETEGEKNSALIPELPTSIKLNSLCCSIGGQDIFTGLNYVFKKGKMYAIVGQNGCGKTTLANVLLGEDTEHIGGTVSFEGMPRTLMAMSTVRQRTIGYCEQEPAIFNDTMRFNLTLGDAVDEKALKQLLELLNIENIVYNAPKGMDAELTNASGLSGGEKQKIAVARVLIKNKPIMIFDEPTSAMDKASKHRLMSYLQAIKSNKIILVITHDQDILSFFDETLVM